MDLDQPKKNPKTTQKKGKKRRFWKILGKVFFYSFIFILTIAIAVVGVGAGFVSALVKDEKIRTKEDYDKKLSGWSQTSYAYFRSVNGEDPKLIGQLITPEDRKLVKSLDEVSPFLINAFLSTEDREFYQHNGIVPRSLARATFQQISGSDVTTGGSTLTQQLVKNEILHDQNKNFKRKALEIVNAIRLEKYYNKEQIFVSYLNSVYFGTGAHGKHMYGVVAAARGIFNKDVKDLDLAQAAYIAGMVQRPNAYNPLYGDEQLKLGRERMELVLKKMLEDKKITQQQFQEALKYDLKASLAKKSDFINPLEKYPYIINAVQNEAVKIFMEQDKKNGVEVDNIKKYRERIAQGGYHIYTTIDEKMYIAMNNEVKKLHIPKKRIKGKLRKEQVGAVLIDNKTGAILSFVSGTDFEENQKDFALDATNQPGSTIKPILVYGPAINEGIISPNSIIVDEAVRKADGSGVYRNANGKYSGPVTATHALQWSLNTTAVKVFRKLGFEKGFDYLRKMDLPPSKYDGEASALGGMRHGYTVKQMTAAFATVGNNGVYNKPHLIEKIVDSNGNVVYEHKEHHQPKQVFKPQATYQLTQMLRQVVAGGTGASIGGKTSGYVIAGKTGTTSNEWDLWFIGYTPNISLGVWSGYDYNARGSKNLAKDAWIKFFLAAARSNPELIPKGLQFKNPGGAMEEKCFECDRVPPQTPDQPGQPVDPSQPIQPGQPVNPEQPGIQPVQPINPTIPINPRPQTPGQSSGDTNPTETEAAS